jgi:hypothetical protein
MTTTISISEIKLSVAELLGFEENISAQNIRELATSFPTLAQVIDGQNFSKKATWELILAWAEVENDNAEIAEPSEEIAEHSEEIFPIEVIELSEEIELVDSDCHFEIIPYVPMTQEISVVESAERSEEKTAIYYAVCCLAVFCILTVQLSIDASVWIFTWLVPVLAKLVNSTVEKMRATHSLYKQVSGVNYLFIQ